jgi:hypothetical protein
MVKIVIGRANKGFEYIFELSKRAVEMYYGEMGIKVYPYLRIGKGMYTKKCDTVFGYIRYISKDFGDIFCGSFPRENVLLPSHIKRDDPVLIKVVESFGDAASGPYCSLKIIEIPDNVKWEICEDCNGSEYVREISRYWK